MDGALLNYQLSQISTGMSAADFLSGNSGGNTSYESKIKQPIISVEFSADGSKIMATQLDKVGLFNIDGSRINEISVRAMGGVATLFPNGEYVVCGNIIQNIAS